MAPEALHRLRHWDVDPRHAGEVLRHVEGLGQEFLDLSGPVYRQLVLVGELVHAQDGDDVLELIVPLQHCLDLPGGLVVVLPYHLGFEDTGGGLQGVHGGVEALLRDLAAQDGSGVKMGKGGGRGGVRQVVGGDVHRLDRGDGPGPGGGDPLLELPQLVGQGGLVAHGGGHPPQHGRDLGARLDVAEDVVDEQQHVPVLNVPEVLRHGQPREGQPHPGPGGLV